MLFSTITIAQPPQWIWAPGSTPTPPETFYTPYSIGIHQNISLLPSPLYPRALKDYPALLIHSKDLNVAEDVSRAILRIQDLRYDELTDSSKLWAGEPQIQFWSGKYHTTNEWWMGKIQGVADEENQDADIVLGKPFVSGGLAFYSRKKEWPINQGISGPIETMRIVDDKVTIGSKFTENKFSVIPYWHYDMTNQFAIDHREGSTHALLTKMYKSTGLVDGSGNRTSYSWHIELPNLNTSMNNETKGALNFCSDNNEFVPGGEGESLTRLVTFLRTGKVGIKNENQQVELHVIGQASINDPATPNKIVTGTHSDYRLAVEGKLVAKEIIVTESNWNTWPDYVFKSGYNLMTLPEVEQSIKQNGHLPGIPSAEDVRDNGINVAEVQTKLLEKIEELTLYMIEMKKENELLKQEINKLK